MDNLVAYDRLFDVVQPWGGEVPAGFRVDFLGTLTDLRFEAVWDHEWWKNAPGGYREMATPFLGDSPDGNGEFWFEAADWIMAALEGRDSFVMVTLGASFGYQAVASYRALQMVNPMPCKLVAIDPVPQNIEWARSHFRDNGIDPDDHWLVTAAISDTNEPVLFPVGAPGSGIQNCIATNTREARAAYARELISQGRTKAALRGLLLSNTTSITRELMPGKEEFVAEVKPVSAMTLNDILGPFDRVDFLEADMQESEKVVFPPFMALLGRKVRRVHLGTHGQDVHRSLRDQFVANGWELVFDFPPDSAYTVLSQEEMRTFSTNDGVLTVVNPRLAPTAMPYL